MSIINIEGIRVYAYHGCLEEEGLVGGNYLVNVTMETDTKKAEKTDQLTDTVDYVRVYEIVNEQMGIRSKLIEHVAKRIFDQLKKEYPQLQKTEVRVTKIKPPIHGAVDSASVTISE